MSQEIVEQDAVVDPDEISEEDIDKKAWSKRQFNSAIKKRTKNLIGRSKEMEEEKKKLLEENNKLLEEIVAMKRAAADNEEKVQPESESHPMIAEKDQKALLDQNDYLNKLNSLKAQDNELEELASHPDSHKIAGDHAYEVLKSVDSALASKIFKSAMRNKNINSRLIAALFHKGEGNHKEWDSFIENIAKDGKVEPNKFSKIYDVSSEGTIQPDDYDSVIAKHIRGY